MDSKRTAQWWGIFLIIFLWLGCSKAPLPTQTTEENIEKQNNAGKIIVTAVDLSGDPVDSAQIYWDGEFIGLTPLEKNDVEIGSHTLRVQKNGYELYSEFVSITSAELSFIEAVLVKMSLNKGQLLITVDQDSVVTTITNENNEVIDLFFDQIKSLVLDPGGYFIKAERPGYRIYHVAVEIRVDSVVIQNIHLEKLPNTELPDVVLALPDSGQVNVPVVIAWESSNAQRLDIDYVQNPGLSGKREVVFQLKGMKYIQATAYNEAGSFTTIDSIYIADPVVNPDTPPTVQLSVEPKQIFTGETVTIRWESHNAKEVSVDFVPGAGLSGAWQVTFDMPGTFPITVHAYGPGGEAFAADTVYVTQHENAELPIIDKFDVSPDSIIAGGVAVLQWHVSGEGVRVIIDQGIGEVGLSGSQNVNPTITSRYTLYATNSAGTVSDSVLLKVASNDPVTVDPPSITLIANPVQASVGEPITLNWTSQNANSVLVDFVPQASTNGQYQIFFSQPGEYVIRATAYGDGGSAFTEVSVTISDFAPPTLMFSAEPEEFFESPGYKIITATAYDENDKTTIQKDTVFVREPQPPALPIVWLAIVDSVEVGQPALVEWHSQNASRVDVDYVQNPGLNGRAEVVFSSAGRRIISATAYNSAGQITVSDTIEVVETNIYQQILPIYVSSLSTVAAIHPTVPQVVENAGQTIIAKAGYYRITAAVWYNSGDLQKNESFFIILHDENGNNIFPEDANAGIYKIVQDDPGPAHVSERPAGLFYLNEGKITISLHHFYAIAQQFPQFVIDGPINGPESVHVVSFKLEYLQP
ncbi:hypothetical protein B6D60_12105 [candidate division KSB1 bacterium 4484_87]|nr:MAG: hypothetical protein B6D60_12105 [candidate division KSB1 bacterium 4484_87]